MSVKGALFDLAKPRVKRQAVAILDQIRAAGLPDPEPEVKFAKQYFGRDWRLDWAWRQEQIALEIEGAMFGRVVHVGEGAYERRLVKGTYQVDTPVKGIVRLGGRHNSGKGQTADLEKYAYAAILGWCVIRVSTTMVRDQQVVPLLKLAFQFRKTQPEGRH